MTAVYMLDREGSRELHLAEPLHLLGFVGEKFIECFSSPGVGSESSVLLRPEETDRA
jgi:hypothetical protein